jgi:hypothetical protein
VDTTPNSFSFTDLTGVPLSPPSTPVASNVLQITGIAAAAAISINGDTGMYRMCADAACSANPSFTAASSTITNGQYLQLRLPGNPYVANTLQTTVTVGGVSDLWSVQTTTDVCAGSPSVGTVCADGSIYAGLSPDGNVKMYTTPADYGQSQFGWDTLYNGFDNGYTGRANSEGQAQAGGYWAAPACAELNAHGKSDWYLPAMYELDVLRQNAVAIGNFDLSDTEDYWLSAYWSSTEVSEEFAIFQWFKNGDGGYTAKGIWMNIRCVRKD